MTLYGELLCSGVRSYLDNDLSGIYSNMYTALNYVLSQDLSEDDFLSILSKSKAWLYDLEEGGRSSK